tara:strand:- start:420 stop:569 length:150 start_codon:yes stop_codon:yes gene_type:complete
MDKIAFILIALASFIIFIFFREELGIGIKSIVVISIVIFYGFTQIFLKK